MTSGTDKIPGGLARLMLGGCIPHVRIKNKEAMLQVKSTSFGGVERKLRVEMNRQVSEAKAKSYHL